MLRLSTTLAYPPMRIAQIAPLYEAVPPKYYGGTERVVAYLCDALTEVGHQVTLFSSADAHTRAQLISVRDQAIRLDRAPLKSDLAAHLTMLHEVRRHACRFDLLHFHLDMIHFPIFEAIAARTITTLHGRLDLKDLEGVYERWPEYALISISNHQRLPLPDISWFATVQHGVPHRRYTLQPRAGNYLAFIGRISPEKRADIAIRLAQRSGIRLRIAAKVDAVDVTYFDTSIKPLLADPLVEFIGEIGDADKGSFLGNALALIFPIDWPEPFGLVMIEALACGTPVVAWKRGAVAEIIDHGETGFIVESEDEALEAIGRVASLGRRHIRAVFERRFTAITMARNYVKAYTRLLEQHAESLLPTAATDI